jgi:hypothetical protein
MSEMQRESEAQWLDRVSSNPVLRAAINTMGESHADVITMAYRAHQRAAVAGTGQVTLVFPRTQPPFVRVSVGKAGPLRFSTI